MRPKQFLPLLGERSIFQDTVLRMRRLKGAREIVVVAGQGHLELLRQQLAAIGETAFIITEPEGRDSAPAIAAAAAWILGRASDGVAAIVAADHHIPDADAFCAAAGIAVAAANQGAIATFGVKPTQPATGYGYIEPGEGLDGVEGAWSVRRFVEKPSAETAEAYVRAGYLWNSGNFVFRADRLLEEIDAFAPELGEKVKIALAEAVVRPDGLTLGDGFLQCPKISIDYAVMEKTRHAAVVPVDYSWSDLGSWQAIHEASARDDLANSLRGAAALHASGGCLVRSATGQLVAIVGLQGVGVVVEDDAVLVCSLDASQNVKALVDQLKTAPALAAAAAPQGRTEAMTAWLLSSALPIWWSLGADHARGGFREGLDLAARPADELRRIRVQARQVYSFAMGGALGWQGPWREAIRHGLDYLDARYRRGDGLYRTLVTADGEIADDQALLYDQAFVLLALASAARALPEDRARLSAQAAALLDRIREAHGWAGGGFREAGAERAFQTNAQMHLFEAALTWSQVDADPRWSNLADEIGELCCAAFIDAGTGALREVFDDRWRPAGGDAGRIVEPGHQFEWSWLLAQWAQIRGRPDAAAKARRLFQIGEAGVDPASGAARDSLWDDLAPREATARLWPQTERLKAAHLLGEHAACEAAGAVLESYFQVTVPGLWRDRLDAEGRFVEGDAPGSSLYHIVAAIAELNGLRIA